MNAQEPNLATREELPGQSATPESIFLSRLRAKDALAYEQLVREYTPRLLAIARRMMRNEEDAADAVQDALLSAYQALDSFESKSSVSTWLHRIVVNACLMKIRKNKRHASIEPLLPAFASDGHHASPIMPWRDDVLESAARNEMAGHIRAAIDRLPDAYRTVLLLRDIEELDTEQTAKILRCSISNVKTRLHRARQAMRTLLDPRFARQG